MHISHLARCWLALVGAGCATSDAHAHDPMTAEILRADIERARVPPLDDAALAAGGALDRAAVVAAVLAENPDLDAARAAVRAAVAAVPSAVALDEPMARYALAPLSIGSDVRFGQRIEVSQRLPWPGRRALRGDAARADAEAVAADLEAVRLELAEAAVQAFDDDYLAVRALDINQHHRELLAQIERSAIAEYAAGRAAEQDPLEARAHVIELERERLALETRRRVAIAALNRLLHRPADAPLPPPPARLGPAGAGVPGREAPPRVAAAARLRARTAEAADAAWAGYPSFEVMAGYDAMWDAWQHRWMIGIGLEIPLARGKRRADQDRARAAQARATAELASISDRLDEDRARARLEIDEATRALELDEQQLLPVAHSRSDAALAGFTVGRNPFSAAVMAEHELRDIELAIEQARVELDRRCAELDRLDGRIPGAAR